MTAVALAERPAVIASDAAVLDRIADRGVEIAIRQCARSSALDWLGGLAWDEIDDIDTVLPLATLDDAIGAAVVQAGYAGAGVPALIEAITDAARRLAAIARCDCIRLRLEVVETDACRRFHADAVSYRLLTTLVGPGTQWIETAHADRIHALSTGSVAIFKGLRLVERPAILHRSPPIADDGDTRLLLAIDPHDPADAFEQWR